MWRGKLAEQSSKPQNYLCFCIVFFFRFPMDSSAGRDAALQFTRPSSRQKCASKTHWDSASVVSCGRRRRPSEIYSTCTSSPSGGSHLERGSTRPAATVGTACVYLFIPATAAPAISVRRFPNAASRHMTQQPSVHLAGMRALPSARANGHARIPSAISLIGRLIQFWPQLISFLERRC